MPQRTCAINGCELKSYCRSWCRAHYARWHRNGDPGVSEISPKIPPVRASMECERPTRHYRDGRTGTVAGFLAHGKIKEAACEPCRLAWNAEDARKRRLKPQIRAAQRLFSQHSLTREKFDELLAAQGGRCAICRTDDPGQGKRFAVDHDHTCCPGDGPTCGRCIRGLLCMRCNLGIGHFGDDSTRLMAAAGYLERTRAGCGGGG